MSTETMASDSLELKPGLAGFFDDWGSDQRAFKGVPWGKAMMWIFLVSDTFIFGCFLASYMTVRMSTLDPWPSPSEVFALSFGGAPIPLILIAIMTFVLITSSGTMALAVNYGYRKNKVGDFLVVTCHCNLGRNLRRNAGF
jgi:cytochrome c oxidase subunit 3